MRNTTPFLALIKIHISVLIMIIDQWCMMILAQSFIDNNLNNLGKLEIKS